MHFPYQSHFFLKKRQTDLTYLLRHHQSWARLAPSPAGFPLPGQTTVYLCSLARRKAKAMFPAEGISARCKGILVEHVQWLGYPWPKEGSPSLAVQEPLMSETLSVSSHAEIWKHLQHFL